MKDILNTLTSFRVSFCMTVHLSIRLTREVFGDATLRGPIKSVLGILNYGESISAIKTC